MILFPLDRSLTAAMQPAPTAQAASPSAGASGKLAFVSRMDGDVALYTIHVDGTGLTPLTHEKMLIFRLIQWDKAIYF